MLSHSREIKGIEVQKIVQRGIGKFSDRRGNCGLLGAPIGLLKVTSRRRYVDQIIGIVAGLIANSFVRLRDSFEKGVTTVMTLRDFTQIFDSYTEFEEHVIGTLMEAVASLHKKGNVSPDADSDLDIRLMLFEQFTDRRPLLWSQTFS